MKKLFALGFALLLTAGSAAANSVERFHAPEDYQLIESGGHKLNPENKLEVVEFFSYLCPHCRHFEPEVQKWLAQKPKDVQFLRMPAVFMQDWDKAATAYYAGEQLKITDKTHPAIFAASAKITRSTKINNDYYANIMAKASGLKVAEIKKAMESFSLDLKRKQDKKFMVDVQLQAVPALMVNGKYMVKINEHVFDVVDFLLTKERSAQ